MTFVLSEIVELRDLSWSGPYIQEDGVHYYCTTLDMGLPVVIIRYANGSGYKAIFDYGVPAWFDDTIREVSYHETDEGLELFLRKIEKAAV